MPVYVGETGRIWAVPLDYDGDTLLDDSMVTGYATIYDADGAEVISETAMTFTADSDRPLLPGETESSGVGYWYYDWDTSSQTDENAAFRARVRVTGGTVNAWEYLSFRLKVNPVTL